MSHEITWEIVTFVHSLMCWMLGWDLRSSDIDAWTLVQFTSPVDRDIPASWQLVWQKLSAWGQLMKSNNIRPQHCSKVLNIHSRTLLMCIADAQFSHQSSPSLNYTPNKIDDMIQSGCRTKHWEYGGPLWNCLPTQNNELKSTKPAKSCKGWLVLRRYQHPFYAIWLNIKIHIEL